MSTLRGCFLVPTSKNPDKGLWFIFHHESDGVLAVDITKEHPDIAYRHFKTILNDGDNKSDADKIVLLGGPMQSDTAMLVIHDTPAIPESHEVAPDLAFLSYRFALIPGQPPTITRSDDTPSRLDLGFNTDFIITMGFRLWDMDTLEKELREWQWTFLPASKQLIFGTPREKRLQKALLSIN